MTDQKHTKEPWMVDATFKSEVQTHDDKTISSCWHEHGVGETITLNGILDCTIEESAANATRIVACVNALAGVEDPDGLMWDVRALTDLFAAYCGDDTADNFARLCDMFSEVVEHLKGGAE